jgi:glycosyltransferase involved in cell wall biosynthesis
MSWKPDVIHFHNIQGNYFDLRKITKISKKTPVLFTLHDPWMFTGHCSYFIECDKWKTGCGKCPDLVRRPSLKRDGTAFNWKRKKMIYEKSKFYIATPSDWLLNEANKSMLKNGIQKSILINNGVDHEVFKPMNSAPLREKLNIKEDEIVLLYVVSSNMTSNPYKDFSTISKCVNYIEKINDSNKKFTLIAIGEEKPESIRNGIRKISIGYLNKAEEIANYFNIADLYLHAARAENYPNVVMEALSSGTPCIVTKTGGVPEQIIENETGWVVPYEDYRAMALKIIELSKSPNLINESGKKARVWIEQNHTKKHMVDKYEKFYSTILIDNKE